MYSDSSFSLRRALTNTGIESSSISKVNCFKSCIVARSPSSKVDRARSGSSVMTKLLDSESEPGASSKAM